MEERIDSENVQQIDLISMLKDIGREWITILLLSVAAALFADIWICATYQPEYKTSTTFVVTAKGMNSNIYQNLSSTKDLAQQFTEILGSNVLKKKVAQDIGGVRGRILDVGLDDCAAVLRTAATATSCRLLVGHAVEGGREAQVAHHRVGAYRDALVADVDAVRARDHRGHLVG